MHRAITSRLLVLAAVAPLVAQAGSDSSQAPSSYERDIYYDSDGLIIHRSVNDNSADGGDTAQREGWYWLGVWMRQHIPGLEPWTKPRTLSLSDVVALLEPGRDGVFYRHPKLEPWNHPRRKEFGFSRDQMEPLVAAMGVWRMHAEVRRLWDALPEDVFGKHAFNGAWKKVNGQIPEDCASLPDGADCTAIEDRGCDATANCSLKEDKSDCSLKEDKSDCSLKEDKSDCSLRRDDSGCTHRVCVDVPDGVRWEGFPPHPIPKTRRECRNVPDPSCVGQRDAKNARYKIEHDACEAAKVKQNADYKVEHDMCEAAKVKQNADYKVEHDMCEAAKVKQNADYKVEHDMCEAAKTAKKGACEVQKAIDLTACRMTNIHCGDLIGPMTVNLFRRAMGESPSLPVSTLRLPPANVGTANLGEMELATNVRLRIDAAKKKDDVGDDLNLVVKLLMSELVFPSPVSIAATKAYAESRPHSYGSYLGKYEQMYGNDGTDMTGRIETGIASGWTPDTSAPLGAVRWYHRPQSGANPLLAELYRPIIEVLIMGLRDAGALPEGLSIGDALATQWSDGALDTSVPPQP